MYAANLARQENAPPGRGSSPRYENAEKSELPQYESVDARDRQRPENAVPVQGPDGRYENEEASKWMRYETVDASDLRRPEIAVSGRGWNPHQETAEVSRPSGYETTADPSDSLRALTLGNERTAASGSHTGPAAANSGSGLTASVEPKVVKGTTSLQRELELFKLKESWLRDYRENNTTWPSTAGDLNGTNSKDEERRSRMIQRGFTLQKRKLWQDSADLIDNPFCLRHESSKVDALYLLSEAKFQLRAFDVAETLGIRALEVLEPKVKEDSFQWRTKFDIQLDLMQRISEASGKSVEARFYRSKISPTFLDSRKHRQSEVAEADSLVSLVPRELSFRRPFRKEITQIVYIKNMQYDPIAFKIKTTAPKQYCVRPNIGRIEAGSEIAVQFILQPMKKDPPSDYECKHKFLVRSFTIPEDTGPFTTMTQLWERFENGQDDPKSIVDKKIRVKFLHPDPK